MRKIMWCVTAGALAVASGVAYWYGPAEPTAATARAVESAASATHLPPADRTGLPPSTPALAESPSRKLASDTGWISELARSAKPEDWLEAHKAVHRCILNESLKRNNPTIAQSADMVSLSGRVVDCPGLTAEQRRDYMSWLDRALASDVRGAVAQRWIAGPNGNPDDLETRRDDPLVQSWMKETTTLLETAASKGDIEAISGLSSIYDYGSIAPRNPARSAMLDMVVLKAREAESGRPAPASRKLVEGHRRRFSPEEIRVLEMQADDFYNACCQKK